MRSVITQATGESIYHAIFDKSPIGIAIVDNLGNIIQSNLALQQMLGYSEEEFKTLNFQAVTYPDDLEIDVQLFEELIKGEINDYHIEKRYYHKNGQVKWGALSVSILVNELGELENVIGMVKDISLEKQHLKEVEELNKQLALQLKRNSVAHSVAEFGYYETDLRQNTWTGSREFYQIFGFDGENAPFTQEDFQSIVHPDDLDEVMEVFVKAMEKRIPFDHEYRCFHQKTNEIIYVRSRSVFEYENDSPISIFGIKYVITRERLLQEKLKKSINQLQEFTYTVSHDLREPIRSISGMLSLIAREVTEDLSARQQTYFQIAIESCITLSSMINKLMESAMLERSRGEVAEFSLAKSIEKVKALLGRLIAENQATVTYVSEDVSIRAYPDQFNSILQNLISNAIKYRSDKSPIVTIFLDESDTHYVIEVKDNGSGIEKAYHDSIFKVFNRGNKKKSEKSTGVGLYVCKKMVELHDGNICLKSSSPKGSVFEFTISKKFK